MIKSFFKSFNLADWVSFFRIASFPFALLMIFLTYRLIFASLVSLNLISDLIDGVIARKMKLENPRGALLDSIGDTLNIVLMIIGAYFFERNFFSDNILLLSSSVVLFLLVFLCGLFKYKKPTSFHTYLSKVSAILIGSFFIILFFLGPVNLFFQITISITILSQLEEIILIKINEKWKSNVKGLFWIK